MSLQSELVILVLGIQGDDAMSSVSRWMFWATSFLDLDRDAPYVPVISFCACCSRESDDGGVWCPMRGTGEVNKH